MVADTACCRLPGLMFFCNRGAGAQSSLKASPRRILDRGASSRSSPACLLRKGGWMPTFEEVYEVDRPRLVAEIFGVIGSLPEAEDAVQEAFVRAYVLLSRVGSLARPGSVGASRRPEPRDVTLAGGAPRRTSGPATAHPRSRPQDSGGHGRDGRGARPPAERPARPDSTSLLGRPMGTRRPARCAARPAASSSISNSELLRSLPNPLTPAELTRLRDARHPDKGSGIEDPRTRDRANSAAL